MTILLIVLIGAVSAAAIFFATRPPVAGAGALDARGQPKLDKGPAPDDPEDALSNAIGATIGSAFKTASLWIKSNQAASA